jgi:arginine deiminase
MKAEIFSEIGPIQRVFVYSPGEEHNLVLPSDIQPYLLEENNIVPNEKFLLFDDIIDLKIAQKQHEIFRDIINFYKEGACIDIRDHFLNISKNKNITSEFPLINLMYPRDIAAIIGNQIYLTSSSSKVRKTENILTEAFFNNQSDYKKCEIIDFTKIGKGLSLEGGDIFVINNDIVLIGISERTSKKAIELIVPYIFKQSFKHVIAVDLPKERAMMHLDTIFTQTNYNEGILFNHKNYEIDKLSVYFASKTNKSQKLVKHKFSFTDLLNDLSFKLITCGGNKDHFKLREQLTDGANSFVLEPGKILMYNCNDNTILELEKNGYKHLSSKSLYKDPLTFEKILRSESKVVISINGSELVKGRGGPRCMTLPINRGII